MPLNLAKSHIQIQRQANNLQLSRQTKIKLGIEFKKLQLVYLRNQQLLLVDTQLPGKEGNLFYGVSAKVVNYCAINLHIHYIKKDNICHLALVKLAKVRESILLSSFLIRNAVLNLLDLLLANSSMIITGETAFSGGTFRSSCSHINEVFLS